VALVAIVLLTGCSWSRSFSLLLTVENANDGQPVPDVSAVLDTRAMADERKGDPDEGTRLLPTDAVRKLTFDFNIGGYTKSDGPWYLKIRKDGFEPQEVDISPHVEVKNGERYPLPVTVRIKPLPKQP
jgi:hypothetical protein